MENLDVEAIYLTFGVIWWLDSYTFLIRVSNAWFILQMRSFDTILAIV